MNREQIRAMAREAGAFVYRGAIFEISQLERFAAAIRAATKEEDAKICEKTKGLDRQGWPKHYEAHEIAADIRASK